MIKQLLYIFIYGAKNREVYRSLRGEVMADNRNSMKLYSVIAAIAMSMLTVTSFFVDSLEKNRTIYLGCAIASIIVALAVFFMRKHKYTITLASMYLFTVMLFTFGIFLGTYIDPDNVSVSFPILLFAVPLLFTDLACRMNGIILITIVVYIVAAGQTQNSDIFEYNLTNVIPYGVISIFASAYMMYVKFKGYELEAENKQAMEEQYAQMEEIMELNNRLENANMNLEEQMKITKSLSGLYSSAFLINTDTHEYKVLKLSSNFNQLLSSISSGVEMLELYQNNCIESMYSDSFAAFINEQTLQERLKEKNAISIEYREHINTRDTVEWCRANWIVIERDNSGIIKDILLTIEVITESVYEREKLQGQLRAVETDELTGLYTRQAFFRYAQEMLAADTETQFDIVMADIVNFKQINNLYGEKMGDDVLIQTANFGRDFLYKNGLCARYGPDQFVALLPTGSMMISDDIADSIDKASSDSPVVNYKVKTGIYKCVDRCLTVSQMCERALLAVNSIKNTWDEVAFFDGEVSQKMLRSINYENWFESAIANKEFVVWYQPKCNPATGKLVGAEALVRWIKDGQMISPGEFIETFERTGQIVELDEYVFRSVCEFQSHELVRDRKIVPISVNLSRRSMYRPNVASIYQSIAQRFIISPSLVPIEITESAVVSSSEIRPFVNSFINEGFEMHMDDFGTGQSSFVGLSSLNFDVIKLDKSLIDEIGLKRGETVLHHIIDLSRELGLHIVAEGVETEKQVQFLREHSCDAIQGYYYSKPLSDVDFSESWLAKL